VDAFSINPGSVQAAYADACRRLEQSRFGEALWSRSLDIWPGDDAVKASIANRLGWLTAIDVIAPEIGRLEAFASSVRSGGFTDVVLLGMGGSSLAPEVLRQVLGPAPGFPRFRVLDSVDPDAVREAMENAGTSLFVLASKSGSTIEPNAMAAEAERRVRAAGHRHWGPRFAAITDEGTSCHRRAIEEGYRDIFVNPSDIGGRYSALSYFGMVPAALMGVDLERLLDRARDMERACREPAVTANPGLALGAFMAAGVRSGRDKLTLLLPEPLQSFGLWVEQLVAESTGKSGTGVVPITGEPHDAAFGDDRMAVAVSARDAALPAELLERVRALPLVSLEMPDLEAIGAEFLRWEVATATAGALLDINPFDEPNVQQAKDATRVLLDAYAGERRLPAPEPHAAVNGARLTVSRAAQHQIDGAAAPSFLRVLQPHDYFCLLAYLPPGDEPLGAALDDLRVSVARATGRPTMFGYGPRYLHSTGQLHKGGANTGVFVLLTAETASDLPVPGQPFTFGVLARAQAIGDFQSLDRLERRALYVHLPDRTPASIRALAEGLLAGGGIDDGSRRRAEGARSL
jgi:glucose-6-phosphate isomerase/transaldolase/glucose-6-phosphate isomerase